MVMSRNQLTRGGGAQCLDIYMAALYGVTMELLN